MFGLTAIPIAWKLVGILGIIVALGGAIVWAKESGRAEGKAAIIAADAKAITEAQQKADKLANELIISQAAAMAVTEKTTTVYRDRIVNAPTTTSCGPAVRDAASGVRALLGSGEASPAAAAPTRLH